MNKAKIFEFFTSIQGEGRYVGEKQIFIRFSGCNLSCNYCDTEHLNGKIYTVQELIQKLPPNDLKNIHSISLTGGEPLLYADFINEFAQNINAKLYLETNATMPDELAKIINNIDYIAADIKLPSCSGQKGYFKEHEQFLKIAKNNSVDTFIKIVFDEKIDDNEIENSINIAKKFGYEIFLQPKMTQTNFACDLDFALKIFENFKQKYQKVRFCPQMHKFWNIR